MIVEDEFNRVKISSAIKYIKEAIELDEAAYKATEHIPIKESAGMEIAGHYGY